MSVIKKFNMIQRIGTGMLIILVAIITAIHNPFGGYRTEVKPYVPAPESPLNSAIDRALGYNDKTVARTPKIIRLPISKWQSKDALYNSMNYRQEGSFIFSLSYYLSTLGHFIEILAIMLASWGAWLFLFKTRDG